MSDILAIDIGTTEFKAGVFNPDLKLRASATRRYTEYIIDGIKSEINPEQWWQALISSCQELKYDLGDVSVLSLSVTTPGLVPMAPDGRALSNAILFSDGRSHKQAHNIRELVGEETFLRETCNLPVSGGSSLASILYIRDEYPELWEKTAKFGHCNSYMVHRLTGAWAIDPSTTSITGLYNTARNDLTWNQDILRLSGIPENKLPPLMPSYQIAGTLLPPIAGKLGLPEECSVLCGGNDAVLACLSAGAVHPGDISHIHGTCEITTVCVDQPISSPDFNVRCHVIPDRWMTFYVLNTGGIALEWFHSVFCRDMTSDQFFEDYLPSVLEDFLHNSDLESLEADLPDCIPYLQGSRYSLEQLTAAFSRVSLNTTREKFLLSLIRANASYHGSNLNQVKEMVKVGNKVMVTGGGARIRGMMDAKRHWIGDFQYEYQEQSSLIGAAILGQMSLTGEYQENGRTGISDPALQS